MSYVGKSVFRREAHAKLTGQAKYVDDLPLSDFLYGLTIRSPLARGILKGIRFEDTIPWQEYTIVSAQDIPGSKTVALIVDDQPILAESRLQHCEEPVLLIAHPNQEALLRAKQAIHLDIDPLPAIFTIEESESKNAIIYGSNNLLKEISIQKGSLEKALAQAEVVLEGTYATGAQEQLYIEPNGMIAVASPEEGVCVWGSLQCPYYVQKALRSAFALPNEKIRVIQTETGGGFGGKEEYPSLLACHAALLAWKSGRKVKMIYDREEDMAATTKRHPSKTIIRSGWTREGKLLALDIDFKLDGGAYVTLTPVVLSRGAIHAAGAYACDHVRVRGRAFATNLPPHGAFRGFGAPQSLFAIEKHLDHVAAALGISPVKLRQQNMLATSKKTATGQMLKEHIVLDRVLERALKESSYFEKQAMYKKQNANNPTVKRGIGIATFMHGSGFTGSGEKYLASVAGVEGTEDGKVRVLAASTEIGQGTITIFSQIVADALKLPLEFIEVAQPDTHVVPDSGPTVASRTCMVVGKLVESAAYSLKQILIQSGLLSAEYTPDSFQEACSRYVKNFGKLRAYSEYRQPANVEWDDTTYSGDAYATYAWAAYIADVSIDLVTYETHVEDFVAVQEVGRVINPTLASGQIEGGIAQGIGYALYENVVWREGRMMNQQMTNYIMPTALDLPRIRVFFEEVPYFDGPSGAKGIGELPMDGPAPAILNAVEDALSIKVHAIPLLPERLMEALVSQ